MDLTKRQQEIFDFIKINQTTTIGGGMDEHALVRLKGVTAMDIAEDLARRGILKRVQNAAGVRIFYTYDACI
jgi:hypothetical protein